ncbi:uncharacterized protein C8Q71DRAFT_765131 [Rhodofomes roseus]|uniref:F-box domain-containing protein n=1 Tax=Rhodofomes roseus TaxID=34475 RepID=A0ABQ8KD72_9APHY|nr:uncharacterized protein C8Q71DRAFT_765131 [Rhodofomes roseus]KAH9835312.1 hypothetical protein C8Q71DRAFT_765131 [Rhodofomes roseus]
MAQTSQGVSPILPTDNSLSVPRHTHTGAEAREEVGLDGGDLRNSNSNDPGLYKSHNPAANSHEESASSSSTLFVTKDTSPTTVPSGDIVPSTISSTNEFSQAHDRLPHSLSSRIPIEIFETVMDVMAYRDLPSAASVSWAWRPRAIHNLYSTIFLDSRKGSSMLVALLRQVPHVKEMLATTSRLVVGHSDGSYRWNLNIDQRYLFVDALPLVFADALPALRVLEFESSLRHSMHPTFYSSLARFKHVRSLHLRHVRLHNTAELRRIVFVFPHLQDLVLHGVTVIHRRLSGDRSQASAYTRFHAKTTPQLQRLEIDPREAHLRCIVDLLVSSGCCASLQHLTTDSRIGDSTSVPNTPQVNRLLQSSGRSLISFHHRDDCYRSRQFAARGYDFDTNAALRHLRLTHSPLSEATISSASQLTSGSSLGRLTGWTRTCSSHPGRSSLRTRKSCTVSWFCRTFTRCNMSWSAWRFDITKSGTAQKRECTTLSRRCWFQSVGSRLRRGSTAVS